MKGTLLVICWLISCSLLAGAQGKKDYYHIPLPIKINSQQYFLSDSYHPQDNYYKQEYIPKGENADKFNSMVTVDVLTGAQSMKDIVTQKAAEIENIKATDPVAHYELFEQSEKGEYMLDFLLSSSNEGSLFVEWNVYRYTTYTDKAGKKGVLLFANSWRAYGDDVNKFLTDLKTKRMPVINMMGAYKIPAVQLNN